MACECSVRVLLSGFINHFKRLSKALSFFVNECSLSEGRVRTYNAANKEVYKTGRVDQDFVLYALL